MTDARLLPTIADEPRDVAHAIELHARIDAVKGWLDGHRNRVREWLEGQADQVEALTGGAFNVPVKGVGRALRTDPSARVVVADREAFTSWWYGEHPDECKVVNRHTITGDIDPALDAARDMLAHDEDYDADAWRTVLHGVVSCITTDEDVLVPEDVTDRLTATDDGQVVDADGQIVDGVEVRQSSRTLQVRPDSDYKRTLSDQLDQLAAGQ